MEDLYSLINQEATPWPPWKFDYNNSQVILQWHCTAGHPDYPMQLRPRKLGIGCPVCMSTLSSEQRLDLLAWKGDISTIIRILAINGIVTDLLPYYPTTDKCRINKSMDCVVTRFEWNQRKYVIWIDKKEIHSDIVESVNLAIALGYTVFRVHKSNYILLDKLIQDALRIPERQLHTDWDLYQVLLDVYMDDDPEP